ncbi:7764_t:CDS:2, partial [Dentiscutata heterogama]
IHIADKMEGHGNTKLNSVESSHIFLVSLHCNNLELVCLCDVLNNFCAQFLFKAKSNATGNRYIGDILKWFSGLSHDE